MNIEAILKCLPHRYPFLLVDRVLDIKLGESIIALKNVSANENFFNGHFPSKKVMPGVLILEALAQAAAILTFSSLSELVSNTLFYLGAIENARFKKMVVPGDQLELHVNIVARKYNIWKFHGQAIVNKEVVCIADMTCSRGKG